MRARNRITTSVTLTPDHLAALEYLKARFGIDNTSGIFQMALTRLARDEGFATTPPTVDMQKLASLLIRSKQRK